jgi:sugar lactone lactonase YvrE
MRTSIAATALLLIMASAAVAADAPSEVWKVEGLNTPESALADPEHGVIYVSNIAGEAVAKDGNGFISRVSIDGKVKDLQWATGLDAPKGLALVGDRLYAADIDQLVAIDTATGKVAKRYPAADAKFLNDVAADSSGRVYVSDMVTNRIWMLDGDTFSVLVEDAALDNPNGLKVDGNRLIVGSWGKMEPDFSTKVPGHLMTVDLATRKVAPLGDTAPVGNIDGVEPDGAGGWYLTDYVAGKLLHAGPDGKASEILQLKQGSADIGIVPSDKLILIPMMNDNALVGYKIK